MQAVELSLRPFTSEINRKQYRLNRQIRTIEGKKIKETPQTKQKKQQGLEEVVGESSAPSGLQPEDRPVGRGKVVRQRGKTNALQTPKLALLYDPVNKYLSYIGYGKQKSYGFQSSSLSFDSPAEFSDKYA